MIVIEVSQNEAISGGKNGGRKGVSSAIRWRRANRGAYTLRNYSEEELFKRDVDPYIIRVGIKQREEVESSKDRPCLTKMMTLPLACEASGERMPD